MTASPAPARHYCPTCEWGFDSAAEASACCAFANYYACSACGHTYEDTGELSPAGSLCGTCLTEGVRIGAGPNGMTYAVYEDGLIEADALAEVAAR